MCVKDTNNKLSDNCGLTNRSFQCNFSHTTPEGIRIRGHRGGQFCHSLFTDLALSDQSHPVTIHRKNNYH